MAGRDGEMAALRRLRQRVVEGRGCALHIVTAPRGYGKTTLLQEFEESRYENADACDIVWATPDDIQTPAALAGMVARQELDPDMDAWRARQATMEACRQQPAILIVDEAHTLTAENAKRLLNIGQRLSNKVPFGLILAGRGQLWRILDDAQVSFAVRGVRLPLERLGREDSARAVAQPLSKNGIETTANALDAIVDDAQGYPFFLQCWGERVWQKAKETGADTIDRPVVQAVAPAVDTIRRELYEECFVKLQAWQCVGVADAVASAFGNREELAASEIIAHVTHALADLKPAPGVDETPNPAEAMWALEEADVFWRPSAGRWRKGIPSLAAYVLDQVVELAQRNTPSRDQGLSM